MSAAPRLLHRAHGLAFVSKPSGLFSHPPAYKWYRRRHRRQARPGVDAGGTGDVAPVVGGDGGDDINDDGGGGDSDEAVETPESEEETTLWHWLRDTNIFGQPQDSPHKQLGSTAGGPEQARSGRAVADAVAAARSAPPTIHLCNRLDRGTSGIVLVAESSALCAAVQKQWNTDAVKKEYLTLVRGRPDQLHFRNDTPLTNRSKKRKGGAKKPCCTEFSLIKTFFGGNVSLLTARLADGGRTHQIRRHLNHLAHQVLGDRVYGKGRINNWLKADYGLDRIFLHAHRLELVHPTTGDALAVEDPLPAELQAVLDRLPEPADVLEQQQDQQDQQDKQEDEIDDGGVAAAAGGISAAAVSTAASSSSDGHDHVTAAQAMGAAAVGAGRAVD